MKFLISEKALLAKGVVVHQFDFNGGTLLLDISMFSDDPMAKPAEFIDMKALEGLAEEIGTTPEYFNGLIDEFHCSLEQLVLPRMVMTKVSRDTELSEFHKTHGRGFGPGDPEGDDDHDHFRS